MLPPPFAALWETEDISDPYHFLPSYKALQQTRLKPWVQSIQQSLAQREQAPAHGNLKKWQEAVAMLKPTPTSLSIQSISVIDAPTDNAEAIQLGQRVTGPDDPSAPPDVLKVMHPWRKGPWVLAGTTIDTEWRSDLKWKRIAQSLEPILKRRPVVLDIGCGNGYTLWRLLLAGARAAIGIDPSDLFLMQFRASLKYAPQPCAAHLFPIGAEALPQNSPLFDLVLSMGVLSHRRSPIDHLTQCHQQLVQGGYLLLETLGIDSEQHQAWVPPDRYAQMNNVWFLPSPAALESWLYRSGFEAVQCVSINQTPIQEQRQTPWMHYHSLKDFLDPNDLNKTIEGHPAPTRIAVLARKP